MKQVVRSLAATAVCMAACTAMAQAETHTNLQAVDENGVSSWTGSHPFTLRGVMLNNPEEILDSTWDPDAENAGRMGAQWQVFVQAIDGGDRGGTACWMGQNYSSLGPWIPAGNSYFEAAWSNEMDRLNCDAATAHQYRKGDLVEVAANKSLFFGGKRNVNEAHRVDPAHDFSIALIDPGHGLPDPDVIRLSDLVTEDDDDPETHEDIFDPTRQSGGEHYQGMRVRIEAIRMAESYYGSGGWGMTNWSERLCTVTDGEGHFFTLRMPLTDLGPVPTDWFSAVGILNQESGSGTDGTFGYELFVQEVGPALRIVRGGGKVFVCWPATYANYVLEWSAEPAGASGWSRVTTAPEKWLAVEEDPASIDARYYRLRQKE